MTITEAIEQLDKSREQISSLENLNKTQRFVQEKIQKQLLAGIEKLSISTKQKKARAIQYTANEELIEQIIAATFLVKTEERRQTEERSPNKEPLKIKSKKEVNVKEKDDKETCWIIGICQLPDGTIILADDKNRTIKRLDNDYKVKDHCDLGSGPLGICCSGESEVAVKVGSSKDGKIQFVHIGATLSQTRSFDIESGGYFGLSFFADKFWVKTVNGINIYNVSGTKLMSIDKSFSNEISESPKGIFPAGADSTSQYISDMNESVAGVDSCRTVTKVFRDKRLSGVAGVDSYRTVTKVLRDKRLSGVMAVSCYQDGILFMAGFLSDNIIMFRNDGICLGELIAAEDNLRHIRGMCFDNKHKRLLVGNSSNKLYVLELDD
ncbi:uncharacterized protein LOC123550306 [Mercenaria mercenaria]|uniref:uncharacterized protein LOC123550306 n=1 Tax=Mercenaria mercenaria TaxID=6596 RepID=UPI00234F4F48|nr:uncharacterized protein LOC123550306 [Mercenaria mercenaria]